MRRRLLVIDNRMAVCAFVLTSGSGIGDACLGIAQGTARYHGVGPLPVLYEPFRLAEPIELLEQVPGD